MRRKTRVDTGSRVAAAAALLTATLLSSGVAAAPAGGAPERLYVSDETGGDVVIVDPQRRSVVARIAVGKRPRGIVRATVAVGSEPEGVAVSHDDRIVYVTCETSNSLYVIDAHTMHVLAQIPTEKRPRGIFLGRQSHRGYATDEFGAALTVFST